MEATPMNSWQWEQGRTEYFQFENLRLLARALVEKEGMLVSDPQDDAEFRARAREVAGLEFKPDAPEYRVWRNYGRLFQMALLATASPAAGKARVLVCTGLCRALAEDRVESASDYVLHLARVFYLPGPAFGAKSYRPDVPRVFPLCAVIRLLLAKASLGADAVSVDDVRDYLLGAGIRGGENWERYIGLQKKTRKWRDGAQERQVREMLIFAAQAAFLKWRPERPGFLRLDLPPEAGEGELRALFAQISPIERKRRESAVAEIIRLGEWEKDSQVRLLTPGSVVADSGLIAPGEGARRRVNHIIIERSPKLRELYFALVPSPRCDITGNPPDAGFPWAENLLEIHHVMPLSSSTRADREGATLMDDLVALTPTSHRAVHVFYRQWLKENRRDDFVDRDEAWRVYLAAKRTYRAHHGVLS